MYTPDSIPTPVSALPPEERKKAERRAIRRRGVAVGLALAAMTVLSYMISLVSGPILALSGWMDFQHGDPEFLYMAPIFYYIYYAVLYLSMMILPFAILMPIFRLSFRKAVPIRRSEKPNMGLAIPVGLAVCLISSYLAGFLSQTLSAFGIDTDSPGMPTDGTALSWICYFIIVAILPAIAEEFAFRGVVFGLLRPFGRTFAIVGSGLIFGIMHGNLIQIPFAIVVGLYFGYLRSESNSMLPAMAVHFLNNGLSLVQEYASQSWSEDAALHLIYGSYLLVTAIGAAALIFLLKRKPDFFRNTPEKRTSLEMRTKFGALFGNAGMIIGLLVVAYNTFSTLGGAA